MSIVFVSCILFSIFYMVVFFFHPLELWSCMFIVDNYWEAFARWPPSPSLSFHTFQWAIEAVEKRANKVSILLPSSWLWWLLLYVTLFLRRSEWVTALPNVICLKAWGQHLFLKVRQWLKALDLQWLRILWFLSPSFGYFWRGRIIWG